MCGRMKGCRRGIGWRDWWNVEILEQLGIPLCHPEGGDVRYCGHDESENERRLNGPVTGGVVARGGAEKEVSDFRCPHPEREELPKGRHHRVLQGEQEHGRQRVADQNGEESRFRLGLVDPGRATCQAVMSGENQGQPEERKADASALGLVEHAQSQGERHGDGVAAAGGLDEGERDGRRNGGEEITGERDGGRFPHVRLEEGDEEAEEVVDGP